MKLPMPPHSSEHQAAAIAALDLRPIKYKLMDREEGYGWTREYADRLEQEYKRFLTLLAKYPDEVIAPSKEVDLFWHAHILDTLKYEEDCRNVFGYFLHHFPYFGMRGKEDAANLACAQETLQRLYVQEFGVSTTDDKTSAYCGATAAAAYCGATATVAYCGAAVATAYCGAAVATAYCGRVAAGVSAQRLKVDQRPGVDPVA